DRNFAAEKFLAASHLIGGLAILALGWVTGFWPFFLLMLVHCLCYVPTISITNSIAFANLQDAQKDFARVRLWGTIGWIAASWPFVFILVDWDKVPPMAELGFTGWLGSAIDPTKTAEAKVYWTFIVSGIASLVLAAFSLLLPHTPPKPATVGRERFAWLEALELLKLPFVAILFFVTFVDAAVHQCYFIFTNDYLKSVGIPANWVMPVMSIGQVAEIGTMAVLGSVLKRLGWRYTMVIGILGHALRFAVFAFFPEPAPAVLINVLHGICYAFFFATVYIFVDEFFPKDARTSAQGLFNVLILGLGPLVANSVWPRLGEYYRSQTASGEVVYDFHKLFLWPSGLALIAAAVLFLFFHPPREATPERVASH
ncbi:MAG TPA: MFS transporter, partial [Pirellulales bacterium]|nr:MFS transporter [Pirellulales bacterium]